MPHYRDEQGDRKLDALRRQAATCQNCDLWANATQTVFGEGEAAARVVMVGEQPGDREDLSGHPFVGAAGRLLDRALEQAGIRRADVYVTNAVKHFSWRPRGRLRIHKTPTAGQATACRPWLVAEIEAVQPDLLILLGATAAQTVMGPRFRVTRERGVAMPSPFGPVAIATVHPASILRAPDEDARDLEMARFVDDLRVAARWLQEHPARELAMAAADRL